MNSSIVKGLIFVTGAAIGSAVTYIFLSKAHKDAKDELIASYEKEIEELNKKAYAGDIPDETQKTPTGEDAMKFKTADKTDYTAAFNPEAAAAVYRPSYESIVMAQATPDSENNKPYLITQEAYEVNHDGYTKFELRYYMDDDYLCDVDDLETPIVDVEAEVGYHNIEIFKNSDAEYIWIKNDKNCSISEIEVYRNGPCPINTIFDPE